MGSQSRFPAQLPYLMAMSGQDNHASSCKRAFFGRRKGHRGRGRAKSTE